jgi:hypothetical protein
MDYPRTDSSSDSRLQTASGVFRFSWCRSDLSAIIRHQANRETVDLLFPAITCSLLHGYGHSIALSTSHQHPGRAYRFCCEGDSRLLDAASCHQRSNPFKAWTLFVTHMVDDSHRSLYKQGTKIAISIFGDPSQPGLPPRTRLSGYQPHPSSEFSAIAKEPGIPDSCYYRGGGNRSYPRNSD